MSDKETPAATKVRRNAPQTTSVEFMSPEAEELTRKQIKAFLTHTNNSAVIRELETVMKSGRDQMGWKHFGRLFMEGLKGYAFSD